MFVDFHVLAAESENNVKKIAWFLRMILARLFWEDASEIWDFGHTCVCPPVRIFDDSSRVDTFPLIADDEGNPNTQRTKVSRQRGGFVATKLSGN